MAERLGDLVGATLLALAFWHLIRATLDRSDLARAWRSRGTTMVGGAVSVLLAGWLIAGLQDVSWVPESSWTLTVLCFFWLPAVVGYFAEYWMVLSGARRRLPPGSGPDPLDLDAHF